MDAMEFRDKVVVVLAAGCTEGRDLARMAARAGARVVVVDHDERQVNAIAALAPDRIEALRLDLFKPAQCRAFYEVWADEPLDLLIQCHPLRAPHRLGAAVQAMSAMAKGLAGGLARGRGRVVMLHSAVEAGQEAGDKALTQALEVLPGVMQAEPWAKALWVTGLRLPGNGAAPMGLRQALCAVMARDGAFAPGHVLPLAPDAVDAGRGGVKPARDE